MHTLNDRSGTLVVWMGRSSPLPVFVRSSPVSLVLDIRCGRGARAEDPADEAIPGDAQGNVLASDRH